MTTVSVATHADIDDLVGLGARLFEEDAAVHDTYIDLTWSDREGHADTRQLIDSDGGFVLIAREGEAAIGHLVGYSYEGSSTREPVRFAVLRSLYLVPGHRRSGVGRQMVERFVQWAGVQGCVEAHVSSYVANDRAQVFYETLGFEARSLSRVLTLGEKVQGTRSTTSSD